MNVEFKVIVIIDSDFRNLYTKLKGQITLKLEGKTRLLSNPQGHHNVCLFIAVYNSVEAAIPADTIQKPFCR